MRSTAAPSAASSLALADPMAPEPPVMKAVFPDNAWLDRIMMVPFRIALWRLLQDL
jgi:hypothetical protein